MPSELLTTCQHLRFTKTYRVNQIMMNAAKFKRVKISPADVMKPMVALLFVNIVILIVWTVVDPLRRHTIVVTQDPFLRDVESYGEFSVFLQQPTCDVC